MKSSTPSLSQLVTEACKHPPGSKERQRNLTKIIRVLNNRLWRERTAYYEDALQETWVYFCKNICEGNAYNAEKASVVTWLNNYLKWRLKDGFIREQQKKKQRAAPRMGEDNKLIDPIDSLPAQPDIPPLLAEIEQWVRVDARKKLSQIHLEDRPHITAQQLILKRLPPETSWKQLAAEYGVAAGTLSSFYQRKCKPLLREYSKSQGYI